MVTCPLLLMKRRKALMQELVSRLSATAMCIALMVRQVNSTPHLLTVLRSRLTSKVPKTSTPTLVKGDLSGRRRSSGRFAIFC